MHRIPPASVDNAKRNIDQLQHTLGHIDCPACDLIADMGHVEIDPKLPFSDAYDHWLEIKAPEIRPRTLRGYRLAKKPLAVFFGALHLNEIHIGHVRAYQQERGKKAGPVLLNGECSCLGMVLEEAGLRQEIWAKYKPRHVPKRGAGNSLSATEEERLREVAFRHPKWRLAAHCMIVMLSTTMNWGELSRLRRQHVDIERKLISVVEAKNEGREREIPINAAAAESLGWLIDRWANLGGRSGLDYLLPKRPPRIKGPWIFYEPMTSIKTAFRKIRKEAGLTHFRIHDCRVQAITKLLSNPKVSRQVSKEIAGHISQAMQDRYSHQQYDTKLEALRSLESPNHYAPPGPQVVEIPKKPVKNTHEADLIQEFADFVKWRNFSIDNRKG